MSEGPLWQPRYLVVSDADFIEEVGEDILGIVHIPGMSCWACGAHLDTAFIQKLGENLHLVGKECTWSEDVNIWYGVMRRARYYLDHDHFLTEYLFKSNQRTALRSLSLLSQLHPWLGDYSKLYAEALECHNLSKSDTVRIRAITAQFGGLKTLLKHRDQLRRLCLLNEITRREYFSGEDRQKIASLAAQGRNHILTDRQNALIHALLEKYADECALLERDLLLSWKRYRGVLSL